MKQNKLILFSIILLALIGSISATEYFYCYQETANASNILDGSCWLNYSGNYNFYITDVGWWTDSLNVIDGNWNTWGGDGYGGSGDAYLEINYTKPLGALNTSLWRTGIYCSGITNISIDNSCWNAYPDKLLFQIMSDNWGNSWSSSFSCYNSTNWITLRVGTDCAGLRYRILEEAMIWNMTLFNENNQTFNPTVQSGSSNTFSLNLTYNNNFYSGITTYLNYNNTNYSTTTSGTASNKVFSSTISVPMVSTSTNKSFYFIVILTNSSGTTYINSNINNQTLINLAIDNCSVNSLRLLNISIYDEDSLASINGTIEALINVYSNSVLAMTYNSTLYYTGTPVSICLNNLISNYSLSYTLKYYGNSSYFKQYKNVQYISIYNNFPTQDVRLYDLLYLNGYTFNVIVVGNILSSNGNSNLLIDAQRQYLSQNQFLSIESSLTDSDGIAVVHLVPSSEVYNFIVSYNGVILGSFNNYQVQCQNPSIGQCSITLNLAQATGNLPNFNNYGNISSTYNLDKINNILYFTFSSTDGNIKNITKIVTLSDGFGNTTICINNAYGTSGTLICNIPITYQNTNFFSTIYIDGNSVSTTFFSLGNELRNTDLYGVDILIELLMFSTLVMLFLSHPILIVIGALLGMFLAIGLIMVTGASLNSMIAVITFFIASGILIIWRISRKV